MENMGQHVFSFYEKWRFILPIHREILMSMLVRLRTSFVFLLGISLSLSISAQSPSADSGRSDLRADKVVTLIFTNDMESAYEPFPAWWRDDMERIGGIAELSTLIKNVRRDEPNVFLFDAGDIFTGALSTATNGTLMFEFMITMGYDAMGIGNHEFDYGHDIFEWEKNRAPFPVLGANIFYKDTGFPYAQPHTIIERGGIRIGVIGILGQDAAGSAVAPRHIAALEVTDPATMVARSVAELRDDVDLIVLLTHQGHTAPMQTDAEIDPRLARDINKDIALAGAVPGIDVMFTGHADAGTWVPVINKDTGTIIMQTFGQATYLGFLQLSLDAETRKIKSHTGRLIPVDSDQLTPDPIIVEKYTGYRSAFPELTEVVGKLDTRLNRKYFDESDIGNLLADVLKEETGSQIGMMHPGGIRKDFPKGDIMVMDVLDTSPFIDSAQQVVANGTQLRAILEQSLTLDRGLMQVSGLDVVYNISKPERQRLISVKFSGREVEADNMFTIGVSGIIARGMDHYSQFLGTKITKDFEPLNQLTIDYFRKHGTVTMPRRGRQIDLSQGNND
jgi:2',3'-cyclic-nucleotide 2'-phosphodiesterase (5'-nucleotidase family)